MSSPKGSLYVWLRVIKSVGPVNNAKHSVFALSRTTVRCVLPNRMPIVKRVIFASRKDVARPWKSNALPKTIAIVVKVSCAPRKGNAVRETSVVRPPPMKIAKTPQLVARRDVALLSLESVWQPMRKTLLCSG